MNILSFSFLLFFVATLVVYYLVPKKIQYIVLFVASAVFFLLSGPAYTAIYLLLSIASVYYSAKYMQKNTDNERGRKHALLFALLINLAMLAVLKYTNFVLRNSVSVINLFGASIAYSTVEWIAPIGISFYTLQVVGYLVDVYWGISEAQPNAIKVALFGMYFPQISSGPIGRYHQLSATLYRENHFSYQDVCFGLQRIAWGVAKKMILAERLSGFVNGVFSSYSQYAGVYIWTAMLAFSLQLYADFSGNMDIVLGVSECFGIRLPENFRRPFFSRSIQEFWQRWHITMGEWLKDYVMFPVLRSNCWKKLGKWTKTKWGRKASQQITTYLGMLVLWIVIGLWHGGSWKFLAQSLWSWLMIVLGQISQPLSQKVLTALKIDQRSFSWKLFQCFRTLVLFSVGLLFFRADSLTVGLHMLKSSFTNFAPVKVFSEEFLSLFGGGENMTVIFICILVLLLVAAFQDKGYSIRKWVASQGLVFRWVLYYGLFFAIVIYGMYGSGYNSSDFVYRGF